MAQSEPTKSSLKPADQKEKAFSHPQRWKEALIFLAFVFLSFCFWMLQSMQEKYEVNIAIPVTYKNVPAEMAFTKTLPKAFNVKIKDKGSVLLNYMLGRTFVPITVTMHATKGKSGILTFSHKAIENAIFKQLKVTTQLISFDPSELYLTYSPMQWKKVMIAFNGEIHTEAGYQIAGDILIQPQEVQVYAPQQVLDTLHQVKTSFTTVENGNQTVVKKLKLMAVKGAKLNSRIVKVTIPIEEFTEKSIEIDVQCTNIPDHFRIRMFPSTVKITCNVPLSRFKEINETMFSASVTLPNMDDVSGTSLPVSLNKKPSWMKNVKIDPDKIDFLLEQIKDE